MSKHTAQLLRDPKEDINPPSGVVSELEALAGFVHGAIAFGNALGLLYNLRRRQWSWCALHAGGIVAHIVGARRHARIGNDRTQIGHAR